MPPKKIINKASEIHKLSIENRYKKKDHRQHVIDEPDQYVGCIETDKSKMYVFNDGKIVEKIIEYNQGLDKIYDEILVNASDHKKNDSTCTKIKIKIDQIKGTIECYNDGENGIPVVIHEEYKIYVPQLIFGVLLTSGNYDQEEKVTGGKNGYGSKLTNILSEEFYIEIYDKKRKKLYKQYFRDNMEKTEKAEVSTVDRKHSYILIRFKPDLNIFKIKNISDDMVALFKKRAYDIAVCTGNINVYFNDELIEVKSLRDYVEMYYNELPSCVTYCRPDDRWNVAVLVDSSNHQFKHVSFVNSIYTHRGGTHVDDIRDKISRSVVDHIMAKDKIEVSEKTIHELLTIFVISSIPDPKFNSQTKEALETKVKSFKPEFKPDKNFINSILNTDIVEAAINLTKARNLNDLKKLTGKKSSSINVPKLTDAPWAGTAKSSECVLILTEGDSAKKFALIGLDTIGRNQYGVYPLRGKIYNGRNESEDMLKKSIKSKGKPLPLAKSKAKVKAKAKPKSETNKVFQNEELQHLLKIMNLEYGKVYRTKDDMKDLRYGSGIMVMVDQDLDGSHILGLLINHIDSFWPSLLEIDGFIKTFGTALVRVSKKKKDGNADLFNSTPFFTIKDFHIWRDQNVNKLHLYDIKYFKGLGSSSEKEAKISFMDFENRIVNFYLDKDVRDSVFFKNVKKNTSKPKMIKDINDNSATPDDSSNDSENDSSDNSGNDSSDDSSNDSSDDSSDDSESGSDNSKNVKKSNNVNIKPRMIVKSSNGKNIRELFTDGSDHNRDSIYMAFHKNEAERRKKWLRNHNPDEVLDYSHQKISYHKFINNGLRPFSMYSVERSTPSIRDGFKPSTRKIFYTAQAFNLDKKRMRVSQLGSYTSAKTAYHHGEVSLYDAIVGMADNFVGSNNINLLIPDGSFTARSNGEAAQPRYIFTKISPITKYIFVDLDKCTFKNVVDDGITGEFENYAPIIPIVLVNGAHGVGTGFSTFIPKFNPLDVIKNVKNMCKGRPLDNIHPWYRGFKGKIYQVSNKKYTTTGVCYNNDPNLNTHVNNINAKDNNLHISEIPIKQNGLWINSYYDSLDSLLIDKKNSSGEQFIIKKDLHEHPNNVNINIVMDPSKFRTAVQNDDILDELKLKASLCLTNMHLYDTNNCIKKYDAIGEIFTDFFDFRSGVYRKRKKYYSEILKRQMNHHYWKCHFVGEVIGQKIVFVKNNKQLTMKNVVEQLINRKYPKFPNNYLKEKSVRIYLDKLENNINDVNEDDENDDDELFVTDDDENDVILDNEDDAEAKKDLNESKPTYDYLLNLKMKQQTKEYYDKLKIEHKESEEKYKEYKSKSVEQIWIEELETLEKEYHKWMKDCDSDQMEIEKIDKLRKKKLSESSSKSRSKK